KTFTFQPRWKNFVCLLALVAASGLRVAFADDTPAATNAVVTKLEIQADQVAANVSPTLYGLMTEEINYSYDGGLYAELIRNRIFKDNTNEAVHWSVVQQGGGTGSISLETNAPINDALTTCLKLNATQASRNQPVGIANDGFWGIPVFPNTRYR